MEQKLIIQTLKSTIKKLKQKKRQLAMDIKIQKFIYKKNTDNSSLNETLQTYKLITDFKTFTENYLANQTQSRRHTH